MIPSGDLSDVLLRCHMHKIYPKGCTLFSKQKALFLTPRLPLEMETGETITGTVIVKELTKCRTQACVTCRFEKVNVVSHFTLHTWRLDGCDLKKKKKKKKSTQGQLRCTIFIFSTDQSCDLLTDSCLGYCCCTSRTFNSPVAHNAVYNDKYGGCRPTT